MSKSVPPRPTYKLKVDLFDLLIRKNLLLVNFWLLYLVLACEKTSKIAIWSPASHIGSVRTSSQSVSRARAKKCVTSI